MKIAINCTNKIGRNQFKQNYNKILIIRGIDFYVLNTETYSEPTRLLFWSCQQRKINKYEQTSKV